MNMQVATSDIKVVNPNKAARLLKALSSDNAQRYGLTSRQIRTTYRVSNPRDLVYRLRRNGNSISTEEYISTKGVRRIKYFLD